MLRTTHFMQLFQCINKKIRFKEYKYFAQDNTSRLYKASNRTLVSDFGIHKIWTMHKIKVIYFN